MDMMAKMLANPAKLAQAQMNLFWDYYSLWQHATMRFMGLSPDPVAAPHQDDKRFQDEMWEEHFLFNFIKQSYLITARHVHNVVQNVEGMEERTAQKVNFFTRQFIAALSPTNFALTNPEVFRETVRSHGQNLVKGLNNLLRDIEEGDGQLRIKMTDTTAFELGKNVAATPGKVIFQNDLMQLLQFSPSTAEQWKRPLLIFPPWINKTISWICGKRTRSLNGRPIRVTVFLSSRGSIRTPNSPRRASMITMKRPALPSTRSVSRRVSRKSMRWATV